MKKIKTKKKLGQHILIDEVILKKIANYINNVANKCTQTIEIGPGSGALTKHLTKIKNFYVVEIDKDMTNILKQELPELKNKILLKDILKVNFQNSFENQLALVGNFPYNISTQIFFKVLENPNQINSIVCTIQKEVAERITAPNKCKSYGILSVLLQAFYKVEYLFTVPPESFYPIPKVFSAVIMLNRHNRTINFDKKKFFQIVKLAFNQRRKKLKNSLSSLNIDQEKLNLNIKLLFQKRPEEISIEEFILLSQI